MYIAVSLLLLPLVSFCWAQQSGDPDLVAYRSSQPDSILDENLQLVLGSRDAEQLPQNSLYGHKYVAGGAGEGKQFLKPQGNVPNKEEVKTDAVLPAYCEPPNPCPRGMTAEDGCLEEFDNTADFSRQYQESQQCMCDEEHMYSCPETQHRLMQTDDQASSGSIQMDGEAEQGSFADALERFFDKQNIPEHHKQIRAKKGLLRRKRHAGMDKRTGGRRYNPYWMNGEQRVHIVAKKG